MASIHQDFKHGFTCFWRIKGFDITSRSSDCSYESQVFRVPMLNDSNWHLELVHTRRYSLGLYLYKEDENQGNSNLDIQMSILTSSGWRTRFSDFFKFKPGGEGKGSAVLVEWNRYNSRKIHVLAGCLTVSCHMSNGATWDKYEQCLIASEVTSSGSLWHSPILQFFDLEPKDLENFPTSTFRIAEECVSGVWIQEIQEKITRVNRMARGKWIKEGNQKISETKSTQTESTIEYNTEHLLNLIKDKTFQYVTLRTPSKEFAVHKALLCARSPFFDAMFRGNMKENGSSIVDIDDVDSDTLSLLLQFLHQESIQTDDLEYVAVVKLFYAADKYRIKQLKKECCFFLKKNSTDENVFDASIFDDIDEDQDTGLQQTTYETIGTKIEASLQAKWCF